MQLWHEHVGARRCLAYRWLVFPSCLCHPLEWGTEGEHSWSRDQRRIRGWHVNSCPLLAFVHILWLEATNALMVKTHWWKMWLFAQCKNRIGNGGIFSKRGRGVNHNNPGFSISTSYHVNSTIFHDHENINSAEQVFTFFLYIPPSSQMPQESLWLIKEHHTAKTQLKIDIWRGTMPSFHKPGAKSEPLHEWTEQHRRLATISDFTEARKEALVDLITTAALLYLCSCSGELDTILMALIHIWIYISLKAFFYSKTHKCANYQRVVFVLTLKKKK